MGSYQQIIVGGMLLVTAFVFGRYVINRPPGSKSVAKSGETGILKLQAEVGPANNAAASDSNALQRSLRDRILGERAMKSSAANALASKHVVPDESPSTPPAKSAEQPIVVPDFSHLELESPRATPPTDVEPQRLPAREIAGAEKRPDFEIAGRPAVSPDFGKEAAENSRSDPLGNQTQTNQARFTIDQKPKSDSFTHRGAIKIGELESKMVPVQRKQSVLTLENREFVDYTTVFGDTLHSLSTKFFGSPEFYLDIYLANRELLRNPSDVPVNTRIKIPVMRTAEKTTPVG